MRPIESVLLVGAAGVIALRSPAARTYAGTALSKAGRVAKPAAVRARHLAGAGYGTAKTRLKHARTGGAAVGCPKPGCDWTQARPSAAEMLEHLRGEHGPSPGPTTTPTEPGPAPARRLRPVDNRPAEEITELVPGVLIGRQIEQVIDKIGLHMDEFRAVTRALNAAGEVEPKSLLALLDACSGVLTTLAGAANMITDIAEHADINMHVDLRGVAGLYEAASGVMAESETVRRAMKRIQDLYAEEIEVERKRDDGKVRPLNPKVVNAA
ncbi:hypothetical protein [Micromonospora tarensis]|uniref:C2H2-type domain-containing protein n=1 Tax=Micromonospora tarensis TaxID=2806100 RepID=A0ABS1YDM4_9ACTN|nr:hypothetical protein [Micromonospora tarensis]MBM0275311.1 hypothetical protein [Micromonospora tarensis]